MGEGQGSESEGEGTRRMPPLWWCGWVELLADPSRESGADEEPPVAGKEEDESRRGRVEWADEVILASVLRGARNEK